MNENSSNQRNSLKIRMKDESLIAKITDEGINLLCTTYNNERLLIAMVLKMTEGPGRLIDFLQSSSEMQDVNVKHVELRRGKGDKLLEAVESINSVCKVNEICLYELRKHEKDIGNEIWFPKYIGELDRCSHCLVKYEPTVDPRHPGFGDQAYIDRRNQINKIAESYKYGDAICDIEYTQAENKTWETVYNKLRTLRSVHACAQYQENINELERLGVFSAEKIPSLSKVNDYLQRKTGFMLRPGHGLLSPRDFLASLAYRVFQATLYTRHPSTPHHTVEPDVIHEFLGHVPMLADPHMAQLSQEIGLYSLGASDKQIDQLSTLYWFTIEFGICKESGGVKAMGAGLLSSYGELIYALSEKPEHKPFHPETTALQEYEDEKYQPVYFVADSVADGVNKLRAFAKSLNRAYSIRYQPYTRSIKIIENSNDLMELFEQLKNEFNAFSETVDEFLRRDLNLKIGQ